MIQGRLDIVKEDFGIQFDEESLHYERFITHLKFLAQRIYRHELLSDQESELLAMIQKKYPKELECSRKAAEYIRENFGETISGEEMMFLAIHIKRVCMLPDMEE